MLACWDRSVFELTVPISYCLQPAWTQICLEGKQTWWALVTQSALVFRSLTVAQREAISVMLISAETAVNLQLKRRISLSLQ